MADYTPDLGNYTELKPFRYWCQKVLPLVYDDSLSYYELLCKVVDYLNKTMEDVETLHDDVVNLHAAYVQLQDYVNTYFDNLDVQEEINNKLDDMAQDGSLSALLEPFIPDLVSDWLAEHITPTTPAIDNTLTVSGAGADAKVTGDNFNLTTRSLVTYSSDYDKKLYNITVPRNLSVLSTNWDDLPTGETAGIVTMFKYGTYIAQTYISYPSMSEFIRIIDTENHTVVKDWTKNAKAIIDVLSYNGNATTPLLSDNATSGWYNIISSALNNFTDKPNGAEIGVLLNLPYAGNNSAGVIRQFYINAINGRMWSRLVSGGSAYNSWNEYLNDNFKNNVAYPSNPLNTDYNRLLSNLTYPCTFPALSTNWDDMPSGVSTGILDMFKYNNDYMFQLIYDYPSMAEYIRVINTSNHTVAKEWTPVSGNNKDIVWYSIGDSITAGSYSTSEGGSVVASNADWAYPNRIATKNKCTLHNVAVPGSKITQFGAQVSNVNSDATLVTITGGANDYISDETVFGTVNSDADYTTVCGAIKKVIESVIDAAPNARVVLISPMIIKSGSAATKWSLNYTGAGGFTYAELNTAMKSIAEIYNIEFIDGTTSGPVNVLNIADAEKDNIHPTKDFYKTVANWIGSKLF